MDKQQLQQIKELKQIQIHYSKEWLKYWQHYSDPSHWQFWFVLAMLIVPLILLFVFMDKRKSLLLGFYGYNVHVIFTYIDVIGADNTYWFYPYKTLPILPSNITLDASLVPVSYMMMYQWTLKHNKNYYLYMIVLSLIFAFIIKPILDGIKLFQFDKGANYLTLFWGYLFVGIFSFLITNLFLYIQNSVKNKSDH